MKYFTYLLIASANGWTEQTEKETEQAEKRFWATAEEYERHLDELRSRVSGPAWNFFGYGFGGYGLHDATMLSFCVGDGLSFVTDNAAAFSPNQQRTSAKLQFLNYERDLHYTFDLRGVSRVQCDLFHETGDYARNIGDLYTYELTSVNEETLQLGFLFASGATVIIQFRKLVFRRRRIKPPAGTAGLPG